MISEKFQEYRSQLRLLNQRKDAWYTIASQKFSEGDGEGQSQAYQEINKIQSQIDALTNPFEANDVIPEDPTDLDIKF